MHEWKIVQGLKKKSQNYSSVTDEFPKVDSATYEKIKEDVMYRRRWNNFRGEYSFDEEHREENVSEMIDYIEYCKQTGRRVEGKKGDIGFRVDIKDPSRIYFFDETERLIGQIDSNSIFFESRFLKGIEFISYHKADQPNVRKVKFERELYLTTGTGIDGTEINEYITIDPLIKDHIADPYDYNDCEYTLEELKTVRKLKDDIAQEYVKYNPEYSIGENGEVYRLEIDESEDLKKIITRRLYVPGSNFYGYEWCLTASNNGTKYGDYKKDSEKFEEHCKYLYSIVSEAYRAKKIKRVKELMSLSKKQDKEIEGLKQKQITQSQEGGVEVDE